MLGHQLPHLPPVAEFWDGLNGVFGWLGGEPVTVLDRAPIDASIDAAWVPPRAMTTWRHRAPLELIRFAGANRLKVEIDYRPERGRKGPRAVEPLSFRRTRDGHLLLFVINDRGQLRSYRVDRIAGIRVLDQSFTPRYFVEF